MTDVIASEWLKIRSVRSTYALLAAVVAVLLLGSVVSVFMVADWDSSPASERARFGSADMSTIVLPFTQLCVAVFGGLVSSSEYATGTIRSTLVAVPRRGRVLAGKAAVVGAVSLALGLVLTSLMLVAVEIIVGARPAPIAPWESMADGVPAAFAATLVLAVTALFALGLGVVVRSTAGTLVIMTMVLYVVPSAAAFLPAPWDVRVSAVSLLGLPPRLAGSVPDSVLSPAGAAVVLVVYLVVALGAAARSLRCRDA